MWDWEKKERAGRKELENEWKKGGIDKIPILKVSCAGSGGRMPKEGSSSVGAHPKKKERERNSRERKARELQGERNGRIHTGHNPGVRKLTAAKLTVQRRHIVNAEGRTPSFAEGA